MHQGFTPAEIDAMPRRDIELYLTALPALLRLTNPLHGDVS